MSTVRIGPYEFERVVGYYDSYVAYYCAYVEEHFIDECLYEVRDNGRIVFNRMIRTDVTHLE